MTNALTVLVVDDHPVVRRGLRAVLEDETWVDAVVEADTLAEAERQAVDHPVGLVALDVMLPDGDGAAGVSRILRVRPDARVVILTMVDDEDVLRRALTAGASGFLLKHAAPETVVAAMHTVATGGMAFGPAVGVDLLTDRPSAAPALPPPLDRLTPREREIVTHLAGGDSNAQIARRLGVSEKTVRNQMSTIFAKLHVADRVQAALVARDAGLRRS